MSLYVAPRPFVLERDYEVPYYARCYEEIMANIGWLERFLRFILTVGYTLPALAAACTRPALTKWYRYISTTQREIFTPLAGGEQQLVGSEPHFQNYILDMRAALERLWTCVGTSKSEQLGMAFGAEDWANPNGYFEAKGEVSDRDLQELRVYFQCIYYLTGSPAYVVAFCMKLEGVGDVGHALTSVGLPAGEDPVCWAEPGVPMGPGILYHGWPWWPWQSWWDEPGGHWSDWP